MQIGVRFSCDDGFEMPGILTMPDSSDGLRRPAILLVYEILGMNDEMKRVARELAAEGWIVLIPDLFDRALRPICIAKAIRAIATQSGQPLDDLEAARRWLAARPEVDPERLGVVGFCMGGGFALVLATTGRYKAVAPFYGDVPKEMTQSCPVVASFGGRDPQFTKGEPRLRASLEKLGVPHDVKVYPDAGHSFYTHLPGGFLKVIAPFTPLRPGHHEPSARDAHGRVVAFFREHLEGAREDAVRAASG